MSVRSGVKMIISFLLFTNCAGIFFLPLMILEKNPHFGAGVVMREINITLPRNQCRLIPYNGSDVSVVIKESVHLVGGWSPKHEKDRISICFI